MTRENAADTNTHTRGMNARRRHQLRKVEAMSNATAITAEQERSIGQYRTEADKRFPGSVYVRHEVLNHNDTTGLVLVFSSVAYASGVRASVEARIGKRGAFRKVQTTWCNSNGETTKVVKGIAWK